jgi:hypothetical protein
MNTRPDTTVGWALLVIPCGMPNAHFSLRRGTSVAVSRAAVAGWKRRFASPFPQPFHAGTGGGIGHRRIGVALIRHRLGLAVVDAAQRPPAHELADALLLNVAERRGLRMASAAFRPATMPLGRHLTDLEGGRLGVGRRGADEQRKHCVWNVAQPAFRAGDAAATAGRRSGGHGTLRRRSGLLRRGRSLGAEEHAADEQRTSCEKRWRSNGPCEAQMHS